MINVKEFIDKNYTPYYGDDSFLMVLLKELLNPWKSIRTNKEGKSN